MEERGSPEITLSPPWRNASLQPLDLVGRIKSTGVHDVIYDWGCGLNHSPISIQVRDVPCECLVSIDAWAAYFDEPIKFAADVRFTVVGDVVSVARRCVEVQVPVDLSLCIDIVEHLEKDVAIDWLNTLKMFSTAILVWIPLGSAPVERDTYGGNNHELHRHRSTWTLEDLQANAFACEVLEGFHTAMFGWRVDACWGVWRR